MKSKIKILVIEDDPVWALFVETIIVESKYQFVGVANTLKRATEMIEKECPDILISDIKIQDSNSLIFLGQAKYQNIPVIFMTNHLENDFYNLSQQQPKSTFLAKPFHKFTLLSTLDLLLSKYPVEIAETDKFITVRGIQQQDKKIYFDDITWIQSEGNYSFINTSQNRKHAKKKSLNKLIGELDARFLIVHKGFAINTNHIQRIDLGNKIIVINETNIPIGRAYRNALDMYLNQKG